MHTHLHQSDNWGKYLTTIGWQSTYIDQNIAFIRNIPLLNKKLIKLQRPHAPLNPQHIDTLAIDTHSLSIIIEPPIHDINNHQLLSQGFIQFKTAYAQSATMHLDLNPTEALILHSFSENARRQIKKAQKNNLVIRTISTTNIDKTVFDQFWKLWENLCDMKHFYKLNKSEMSNKLDAFTPLSHLIFAYQQDQPIAVVWYVIFDQTIYYLHTGITQTGYELAANYQLVWEGIKLGKQYNCTTFDFEGLYDPRLPSQTKRWKGFSEFKSRFHGQEIYYPLPLVKHYNPIFKAFFHFGEFISPA